MSIGHAQLHDGVVGRSVLNQRNGLVINRHTIELGEFDAHATIIGVENGHVVAGLTYAPLDRELRPHGRNTGFYAEGAAMAAEAEHTFYRRLVHPCLLYTSPSPRDS